MYKALEEGVKTVSLLPFFYFLLFYVFISSFYISISILISISLMYMNIVDRRDEERKMIVILCNKGTQLDPATYDHVVNIKQRYVPDISLFIFIIFILQYLIVFIFYYF